MIMKDEAGQYSGIKCDECDTSAPPAKEIMRGHGLNNMGWYCGVAFISAPITATWEIENDEDILHPIS